MKFIFWGEAFVFQKDFNVLLFAITMKDNKREIMFINKNIS